MRDVGPGMLAWGIAERVDDYCATAYVYCREPQPVPRLDVAAALADIERRDYEQPRARRRREPRCLRPPRRRRPAPVKNHPGNTDRASIP